MKYKGIIFDMDGTIIDTSHIWQQVTRDLITSKVGSFDEQKFADLERQLVGLANEPACTLIKEFIGTEHEIAELVHEKQQRALAIYAQRIDFIDGFQNFHQRTIAESLKVGIATNADDYTLKAAVDTLKLREFFGEHIYNITHVGNKHKPHPDLYLHAADKLGLKPHECVAIEDSHHGVSAARAAGMLCIGINSGKDKSQLKDAHFIIDHYDEICLNRLLKKKSKST